MAARWADMDAALEARALSLDLSRARLKPNLTMLRYNGLVKRIGGPTRESEFVVDNRARIANFVDF